MSAVAEAPLPIQMTDAAANKVKTLITEEENPELKLRVYITGGGCSGFQYGFTFDEKINDGDTVVEKSGVTMVIDPMSLQYLVGGSVDYTEGLEGSRFTVTNPNATTTCGGGSSQKGTARSGSACTHTPARTQPFSRCCQGHFFSFP